MNVLRIGFMGTRTVNHQETADFFENILGLQAAWAKPEWAGFRLPTGKNDFVEVFGPTIRAPNLYPDEATGLLVAFIVDDVIGAFTEVLAAGLEPLADIYWAAEGFGWFFLRGPDGNIYCIEQVPD